MRFAWNQLLQNLFFALLLVVLLFQMGCASFGKTMKALVSGGPESEAPKARPLSTTYSEKENLGFEAPPRQYRRVNREAFENEALIKGQDGSLWVMEGQGSYLFTQNTIRLVGDSLTVRVEGEPKKQLETKTDIIRKLIAKALKKERQPAQAQPGAPAAGGEQKPAEGDAAAAGATPAPGAPAGATAAAKPAEPEDDLGAGLAVENIPTRIVERLSDGNYRVRGSQSFMIGKHEYRVLALGVVKPTDITSDGIDSSKMLDSKFDIVSTKKENK